MPDRRRRRLVLLVGVVLTASGCGRAPSSTTDGGRGVPADTPTGACTISETGRRYLPDELGLHLYVEPQAFGPYDGGLLVAGAPTHATRITDGERASLDSSNDFFGVVVVEGTVRRIPMPPGVGAVGWVRGAPTAEDRWGFIFDEVEEAAFPDAVLVRILYGEYGPDGWGALEELPLPPDARVRVSTSSSLVRSADGPAWAAVTSDERGRSGAVLFTRGPVGWDRDLVLEDGVDALDLVVRSDGALVLGVGGLDPEHSRRLSSVRVYASPQDHGPPLRVARGLPEGGRHRAPLLAETGDGVQVAWMSTDDPPSGGAWIASLERDGTVAGGGPAQLDGQAMLLRLARARHGAAVWATEAVDRVTGGRRIRVFRSASDDVRRIADIESPYLGPFAAFLSPEGALALVGPEAHLDSTTPFVRSLLLGFDLSCTPVSAADRLPGR